MLALLLFACLLLATWAIGRWIEQRHLVSIARREEATRTLPCVTISRLPAGWSARRAGLVTGEHVVSIDYFKRLVAWLRGIVGGAIPGHQSLLERGRREALLRLEADAARQGFHAVINVRLDTARIASARSDGKGTAGVALVAYGTGLELSQPPVVLDPGRGGR